jgi:excisionase family DNA binding protein
MSGPFLKPEPKGNVSTSAFARVRYLSTLNVARRLGVCARTIRLWAACGDVPAVKFGRQWRFEEALLADWIARRGQSAQTSSQSNKPIVTSQFLSHRSSHGNFRPASQIPQLVV